MPDEGYDILQIIKYHAGELDAKAMHQLELRAQHDPFLMEAMEGYENIDAGYDSHLTDIRHRLNKRVSPTNGRIIPWRMLSIAASLVMLISVLGVFWFRSNKHQEKILATNIYVPKKPKVNISTIDTVKKVASIESISQSKTNGGETSSYLAKKETEIGGLKPNPDFASTKKKKRKIAASNFSISPAPSVAVPDSRVASENKNVIVKDSTPLNEMIVMDIAARKDKNPENIAKVTLPKKQPTVVMNQLLPSKVDGLTKTTATDYGYSAPDLQASNALIKGKVVGKDGGFPVVGAIVKVEGTSNQTLTDDKGSFTLKANTANNRIVVGYLGYETKKISASNKDSLKKIVLDPVNNALAEVIVADYNKKVNDGDTTLKRAHPKNGWGNYRKYLKTSEGFSVGAVGLVKLSFEVDHEGNISNIKVLEGLTDLANKKAIELVTDGPVWIGNTSGAPEKVTFKIKFLK